ncbi:Aste57867_14543 [Aphanomyces stellatus]|uniref:Aste57867_14543 protein n=1 Tax=Aphanomyces stellatus TaxID=120398 RepID=A0A485L1R5_9STRA|nr:hypothetical protein As57867_014489 [Aphanomyces stellatus]VFT91365.1 Aste57867_14543 [Aphanomyces stellatus]
MGNILVRRKPAMNTIHVSVSEKGLDDKLRRSSTTTSLTNISAIHFVEVPEADRANQYQIWALGILIVMGGQFYGWNAAWSAGFVPFFVAQVLMGLTYIVYVSCLSEIGSKVTGGSYGLNRAVLGLYPGFILGCLELMEYISMASVSVLYVANFITTTYNWDENLQPLIWLVFYVVFIAILNIPGRYLYSFLFVFNFVGILVPTLLFIVSALPHTDFAANAVVVDPDTNATTWAAGDIATSLFGILPLTTTGYAGIESLTVCTNFARNPTKSIPWGSLWGVRTLFVINITLVLIVASLPPGITTSVNDDFLLNTGYQLGLGLSPEAASWLIMPAQMSMAFGFFIPYSHLMQAMADSNLLPSRLNLRGQPTSFRAMVVGSLFGYLLCVISFVSPAFQTNLQNLSLLSASLVYGAVTYGFTLLRTSYKVESTTGFISPFGIPGAYFVCFVYFFLFVSIAGGFQGDDGLAASSLFGFIVLLTLYYHKCAKTTQTFSEAEYKSIFKFCVMKYNKDREKIRSRRNSQTSSSHLVVSPAMEALLAVASKDRKYRSSIGRGSVGRTSNVSASERLASLSKMPTVKTIGSNQTT